MYYVVRRTIPHRITTYLLCLLEGGSTLDIDDSTRWLVLPRTPPRGDEQPQANNRRRLVANRKETREALAMDSRTKAPTQDNGDILLATLTTSAASRASQLRAQGSGHGF